MKMHEDEVHTDVLLVHRLLAAQFPEWASLPIERVSSSGTVNALYRLGDELVVRLPRMDWGVGAVDRELRWLPKIAPLLPVAISVPLAKGVPAEGYPWEWGVYTWLEGENPTVGESESLARELAGFVHALHAIELPGGPPTGRPPLEQWDETVRGALAALKGVIDTGAAAAAWEASLRPSSSTSSPVWIHADLMPGNVLVQGGTLTGVIDWGGFGMGEPAWDFTIAWNLLAAGSREVFRAAVDADDAAWLRGRGFALCTGLAALPYYAETNPVLADNARYRIDEVLGDYKRGP